MAGSTLSLDSLSSPSPSPSPPPETTKPLEPTSAGLDSDSELSELTEEEQETNKRDKSPRKGARNGVSRRGRHPSRRGGRRKTSSIVPAPMWGWAETKSSSNVVEEEEEEEIAGPPRAMEEEEEDEEPGDDDDDDESSGSKNPVEQRDVPALVNDADDDESVSGDGEPGYKSVPPRRSTRKSGGVAATPADSEEEDAEKTPAVLNGVIEEVDVEADDDDASDVELPPAHMEEPQSENETESEDEGPGKDLATTAAAKASGDDTPGPPSVPPLQPLDNLMDADIDVTAPPPQDIAPLAAAAAASSIMAGSGLIDPPSPSSSTRSTSASPSAASSRSPSPVSDIDEARTSAKSHDAVAPSLETVPAQAAMEVDVQENDAGDNEVEIDDAAADDDLDMEVESDLQPAHRAEALDVLATIELKFALLRERVYVEKMEGLAWEEALVLEGTHPELLHLHRELSNRRDKRLELATRKRSYEIAHVAKRRRTDEDATWSWWKLSRDELQTDMISETNRKRRRMERERRAIERPQPLRRIPALPQDLPPSLPLRKIIKSFPFGVTRRQSKSRLVPRQKLVYPELSTLSNADISNDLDFLFQARMERERGRGGPVGYDLHVPRAMNSVLGVNPNGSHMSGLGIGLPPVSHPIGYDNYNDGPGMPAIGSFNTGSTSAAHRILPLMVQQQQTHNHHSLPSQPHQHSTGAPMMPMNTPFSGPPGSRNVHVQSQQHHPPPAIHNHSHNPGQLHAPQHHSHGQSQFTLEQPQKEMGGGMSNNPGSQMVNHHSYFGAQASGSLHPMRRSLSPVGILPTGGVAGGKMNGNWMGVGMGMAGVYPMKPGRDRDGRIINEDEEREKATREREKREKERDREREREREREQRERERERERDRERDREREREREREHQDMERERLHHMHHQQHQHQQQKLHQQQMQHRHPPPPQQHLHHHSAAPGGQQPHHHINAPHHHHRPHHHHVLHHHHQPQSGPPSGHASSSLPPPGALRSPRSSQQREYDSGRSHGGHNQHPTEIINLTSAKSNSSSGHSHWKGEDQQHPLPPNYRDVRNKHGGGGERPLGHAPPPMMMDDRDRPLAMPFVMSSTQSMPSNMSPPAHGPAPPPSMNGTSSPRGAWNPPDDNNFRIPPPSLSSSSTSSGGPPPGYHTSPHDAVHSRSPSHRYSNSSNGGSLGRGPPPSSSSQQASRQNSIGLHSPPRSNNRSVLPPASPSGASSMQYPNSNRSPTRFGPPPPSQGPHSSANTAPSHGPGRSPPVGIKLRPPSPLASKMLSGPLPPVTTSVASVYSPRLSGPGRTSTPGSSGPLGESAGIKNTRTSSPHMPYPPSGAHGGSKSLMVNGNSAGVTERDRDRERERDRDRHPSPHLGPPLPPAPSKMSVPQMVDGN